nr:unnamed protein product [Callosobruchus analis]
MGLLSNSGPPDWHPAGQEIKNCLIFEKLTVRHWENVEIENYRKITSGKAGGGGGFFK